VEPFPYTYTSAGEYSYLPDVKLKLCKFTLLPSSWSSACITRHTLIDMLKKKVYKVQKFEYNIIIWMDNVFFFYTKFKVLWYYDSSLHIM
jgi:hypothetical protein